MEQFIATVKDEIHDILGMNEYSLFEWVGIEPSRHQEGSYTVEIKRDHAKEDIFISFDVRPAEQKSIIEYSFDLNVYEDSWYGVHSRYSAEVLWIQVLTTIEDHLS